MEEQDFIPEEPDFIPDEPDFIPDTVTPPTNTPSIQSNNEPSALSRIWSAMSTPLTDLPSRVGKGIADWIDRPQLGSNYFEDDTMLGNLEEAGNQVNAMVRGGVAGGIEGAGNLLSSMTSPIDLGAAILSGGSSALAKKGLTTGAKVAGNLARVASAPVAAHGASTLYNAEDLNDIGSGLLEMAGGTAGMLQSIPTSPTHTPKGWMPEDLKSKASMGGEPVVDTPITPPPTRPSTIYIKPSDTAITDIKKATEAGYTHAGMDDKGRVKMTYSGKPQQVGPLETEIGNKRGGRGSNKKPDEISTTQEVLNFPRAVMASTDFSAPLRQGLPLIHKKAFWTSLDDMFKAWASEDAYKEIQTDITSRPLFKPRVGPDNKVLPSFAEDAGLKLSNLDEGLTGREEALQSTWAEMLPGVRRSNRAYTAFLNKLRADTFENLVEDAKIFGPQGSENNVALAKELANFVNTASGRGSLGKLESSAKFLNATLFAPRLIASRLQMLNPHYYWAANPTVRKEAMKSLLAVTGTGLTLGQLSKLAGAEVHSNPTSADFGKIKIGDFRLDPFAGFQQYAVLAARMLKGEVESTTTGNTYKLGEKFGRPTRLDIAGRFVEGKANPIVSFVTGLLRGKDFVGQPFDIPEELASRVTPIYLQDLKEVLTENPNLVPFYHDEGLAPTGMHPENLPYAIPPAFGMGMQNYGSMK